MSGIVRFIGTVTLISFSFLFFILAIGPTRQAWDEGAFLAGLVNLLLGSVLFFLTLWMAFQVAAKRSRVRWAFFRLFMAILVGFLGFGASIPDAKEDPLKLPIILLTIFFILPLFALSERAAGNGKRTVGMVLSLALAGIGILFTIRITEGILVSGATSEEGNWPWILAAGPVFWIVFWFTLAWGFFRPPQAGVQWLAGMTLLWASVFATLIYAGFFAWVWARIQKSDSLFAGMALIVPLYFQALPFFLQLLAFFLLLPKRSPLAPWLFILNGITGLIPPLLVLPLLALTSFLLPPSLGPIEPAHYLILVLFGACGLVAWFFAIFSFVRQNRRRELRR